MATALGLDILSDVVFVYISNPMSFIDIFSRLGMRGHQRFADIRFKFDRGDGLKIAISIERFDEEGAPVESSIPDTELGFWLAIGRFMIYWFGIIRYTGCHDAKFTRIASLESDISEAMAMVDVQTLVEGDPIISFSLNKQTQRPWVFVQGLPSNRIYVHSFICFRLVMDHLSQSYPDSRALIELAISWMEKRLVSTHPVEFFDTDPGAADLASAAMLQAMQFHRSS